MASSVSGQDESNPALWLATRTGKTELSCLLGTTRPVAQEKFPRKPYNKSFIDQACSIKMAGYWPRSFFACLWTETESRSIDTRAQKKNLANIQPSWPHTWSILGSLRWPRRQRQRHRTKELMSSTMVVHVRYNSWYISLPSSAKQQREMTKFCVFWRTWTTTANFLNFHFEFIDVS